MFKLISFICLCLIISCASVSNFNKEIEDANKNDYVFSGDYRIFDVADPGNILEIIILYKGGVSPVYRTLFISEHKTKNEIRFLDLDGFITITVNLNETLGWQYRETELRFPDFENENEKQDSAKSEKEKDI